MILAKNLENLGTESAFSVLAEAKALEAKVLNFMKQFILPFASKLSNTGLDKLLASVGGWGPVSEKVLWPYDGATAEDVETIKEQANIELEEIFNV